MLLIVCQLAERGARMTAASDDDAPVEQPRSDDLQEASEGSTDGVDAATQTVKHCVTGCVPCEAFPFDPGCLFYAAGGCR